MKKKILLLSTAITATAAIFAGCTDTTQENRQEQVVSSEIEETQDLQVAQQDTIKGSIPSEAEGSIGDANLKINYHAPGVKGRVIWGGLVPYDQVWVTGAHMATTLITDKDIVIGGTEVPAGKYALFTIPGRDEWTVIINSNWRQHLADDYSQKDDILRVQVKPEQLEQHQERLKYEIVERSENEGAIKIAWEKLGVTVPVRTK